MKSYQWGRMPSKLVRGSPPKVEQAKSIQEMLNQKMDVIDIAECLGIKRSAVYQSIRTYGLRVAK